MSIKKILVTVSAVIVLGAVGYYWMHMQPKEQVQPSVPTVSVVRAVSAEVYPESSFVAKAESQDKVGLRARVEGFLQERLFQEGDMVQQGQPLFIIEQVNFEAAVRSAQANYDRAVANEKNATLQYERTKKLYQTKDVSKSKLDEAEAAYTSAKAGVNQMKAQLDLAQKDLEYTIVKAPMDGKVGEYTFSVGELIGPASGILAQIVKIDPMDVVFSVSENQLDELRRQMPDLQEVEAHFVFADNQKLDVIGTVDFTDIALDEQMNTLKMKASFPNQNQQLISGQYGRVVLKGKNPVTMLLIPQKAVQRSADETFVYTLSAQNSIEKRKVKTGIELPDYTVEIIEGLKSGEPVVVEGFQKIAPGVTVQPQYE